MSAIEFSKMSGCGNDFILIDNRQGVVDGQQLETFVVALCRRRVSVGADGLILIEKAPQFDFKWRFFNADGTSAAMCGNGARCAARFAFLKGIAGERMTFLTGAGPIEARVMGTDVRLKMPTPKNLCLATDLPLDGKTVKVSSIDTGVPHVVLAVEDLAAVDVVAMGRAIRGHNRYAPRGANVNFVAAADGGALALRTYERGVEDETLACGTGAVAAALVTACRENLPGPLTVRTWGGRDLRVHFQRQAERFLEVYLEGEARLVCQGRLSPEAWQ